MLLRSPLRVGAPQEPVSVLLRSTPGSEVLRSQGRCSSGAGARGGSRQERQSPTTPVARLNETCVAGYDSRKMGDSGPPPLQKNGYFLPKKGLKMPILGQNQCFLGLGGQFKDLHPISQLSDSKKHVLQNMRAEKWVIQGRPTKDLPFFGQKRPKNANFGQKPVFLGLGWPVQGPPPYFAVAGLKEACVAGYENRKIG